MTVFDGAGVVFKRSSKRVQKFKHSSKRVQKEFKKLKGWSSAFNLIHTCFEDGAATRRLQTSSEWRKGTRGQTQCLHYGRLRENKQIT